MSLLPGVWGLVSSRARRGWCLEDFFFIWNFVLIANVPFLLGSGSFPLLVDESF